MSDRTDTKKLFGIVIVGVVLYVVLDAVAQLLPPHYSPISQAESDLAVGPYGYVMTINFLNRGILSLVFIYALAKTIRSASPSGATERSYPSGSGLFAIWAFGAILLAIFPTDVPSTPVSWHGAIHLVVAVLAFFGGALGELRLSTQFDRYGALKGIKTAALAISVFAVIAVLVDLGLPFVFPHFAARVGGLTERVFLGSVLLWIAVVSAHLLRRRDAGLPQQPGAPQS